MLTRLRASGFKNLVDVEVRFGPFTCIAGLNGVGKSNLFDAVRFLAVLADKPFVEAASEVRGGTEVEGLFTAGHSGRMVLDADLLIPPDGEDDFNQPARASWTFLNYTLTLQLERGDRRRSGHRIRLCEESLNYIPKGESRNRLAFAVENEWFDSVIRTSTRRTTFISTEGEGDAAIIRLQSDRSQSEGKSKRGGGRPVGYSAKSLPRTVLSSAQNAEETRTAVLVRREMRRWRQLQLEPTALRRPDDFRDEDRIDVSGAHVPGALYRLASGRGAKAEARVYQSVANRLAELVEGVRSVRVERDEARKTLQLLMKDRTGLELPAGSLSDGTLRFVALAVIAQDPLERGVLCLEEPENGIHPQRVGAMVDLLYAIATDTTVKSDEDNPLRQVIVTTHSPLVTGEVAPDDLVFARPRQHRIEDRRIPGVELLGVTDTWRARESRAVSQGAVLSYLRAARSDRDIGHERERVVERFGQLTLPLVEGGRP